MSVGAATRDQNGQSDDVSAKLDRNSQQRRQRPRGETVAEDLPQGLVVHRGPGDGRLPIDLRHGHRRQHQHVHRDRAQQVDAHSHQLLSVQPGGVRPVAVGLRSSSGDLPRLVQVPVRVRRDFLHNSRPGRGDVDQRLGPHHHRIHRRTIFGHLPPVPLADHVEADESGETDPRDMAGRVVVRVAAGVAVRPDTTPDEPGDVDVHREESSDPTLVRVVHVSLLRDTDEPHHRVVRADRAEVEKVEHDEEEQRQGEGWQL